MTAAAVPVRRVRKAGSALPVATVVAVLILVWYVAAALLNASLARGPLEAANPDYTTADLVAATFAQQRPLLPAPHQIVEEVRRSVLDVPVTSPRNLLFHVWVTVQSTVVGFLIGTALGIALAAAIIHSRVLDKSLMPWVIASQTVPILAIAPIVIVVLANLGQTGILPNVRGLPAKAIISAYLAFFPVTVGMVKGFTSPERLHLDLMATYSASRRQTFAKLRWPAAVPFLFASLKVAVAASLIGAIAAELPASQEGGLGARLLAGSYYGQTIQIWAALVAASVVAATLVALVALAERLTLAARGMRR